MAAAQTSEAIDALQSIKDSDTNVINLLEKLALALLNRQH